ncbi:MAG: hypothetical protein P1U88_06205 [Thalassobaculaceae bacterium]|nr:hypothetical protein [Thalassobaculaceae bacterium]
MSLRDAATYLFSLLIVAGFAVSGVYAFHGAPIGVTENTAEFERPGWAREIDNHVGFPAYRLRDDGSSVAIGRVAMLSPERLRLAVFPDVQMAPVAQARVLLLETNARSLLALVPDTSRLKIAKDMERVARSMRDRFVTIVRDPAFDEAYRNRLQEIIVDAYRTVRADPGLDLATDRAIEIYRREYAPELSNTLLLAAIPRLRAAALEMMIPSWQGMLDLLSEGKVDYSPLGDAAADLLRNDAFFDSLVLHALDLGRDRRFWRVGVLLADAFIDAVSDDPRTEALLDDISRDPAFHAELQVLEREAAAATTTIFSTVVGRGPDMQPDALAVRIIRYILLRRPRVVAVVLQEGEAPPSGMLDRFIPLTKAGS